MHAFPSEDIDGSGDRCGRRGHKTVKRPSSNSSITNADEGSRNIHFPAGNGYVCNGNCHVDSFRRLMLDRRSQQEIALAV